MKKIKILGYFIAIVLLSGCTSAVRNYGLNDNFSTLEATAGSSSTPEQCAHMTNAVWVEVESFRECIRYSPSSDFDSGHVRKAIVYIEGDILSLNGASPSYGNWTRGKRIKKANIEQERGGTAYMILARPGTEGSSGNQNWRRTRYETLVINAALEKIKAKYRIEEFGLVGQSGGGGLVAALIAERQDVLCAVSASGVTAVRYRVITAGRSSDYTGQSISDVWDPVDQLPRVHPMSGFRMFVTSDQLDTDVSFSSQDYYVRQAKKFNLEITQIMVHGAGIAHHWTSAVGNRVVEDCMLGISSDYIFRTYSGMSDDDPHMTEFAAKAKAQLAREKVGATRN